MIFDHLFQKVLLLLDCWEQQLRYFILLFIELKEAPLF